MKVFENIDLAPMSYMKIGGQARYLIEIEKENELHKISEIKEFAKLPVVVLGEGSNTVFDNVIHEKVFVRINMDNILKTYEGDNDVAVEVEAGANWDEFVAWTVKNKLSGIECLSGIPGTVGAAPIQNIGAYGGEVSNTITKVRIFSLEDNDFYNLSNEDCRFSYRDSILKQNLNKFIITKVSFMLSKEQPQKPTYKDLALHFLKTKNKEPTLKEIRGAVLDIRAGKLCDPKVEPNCGSFFKNPIIPNEQAKKLIHKFKDMPQYKFSDSETKLSGGWLIEKSGFKGKNFGRIKVSDNHSLVLTSKPGARLKDLKEAKKKITDGVEKNFGVTLEIEPNIIEA